MLIEDCVVRGASDAGLQVGQSEIIIVRRNYVYENVAGIAIENSKFADVYDNETTGNTGGILVSAPDDKDSIDTIPLWGDISADLDDRARGYLDINCAHCHSDVGAADYFGLLLEYYRAFGFEVGERKSPIAAGGGSGGLDYDIVPGDAAASIIDYRMDSNEPAVRMPEIGRLIIHTEGFALIRDWINAMEPKDCEAL